MLKDFDCKHAEVRPNPYRISDGGSLYLLVRPSGVKSWEFRFRREKKVRAAILGTYPALGVREARMKRDRARALLNEGLSPIAQKQLARETERQALTEAKAKRQEERQQLSLEKQKNKHSLEAVFEEWFAAYKSGWSADHADQVYQSIQDHVLPTLGNRPVGEVTPADVLNCLRKLLDDTKAETASRVKQRLSAIFEYAVLHKMAPFDPVAQLSREFAKQRKITLKVKPKRHFPAVPPEEVPQLLRAMDSYQGSPIIKTLMWVLAYTGLRTFEARYAEWTEFDFKKRVWKVPGPRMKMKEPHSVPLSDQVLRILHELRRLTGDGKLLFPNERKKNRPVSENAVLYALGALGYQGKMCGHGFRTVFSTHANESEKWRGDAIEAALSHKEENEVRDAYNRAKYLEERRKLMQWWADEITRMLETGETVPSSL